MKLVTRRILLYFCVLSFFIASPLIILYTFGFRYDFTQKKILETGIIYLTPNVQDNIKILIDGKENSKQIKIKGIFKKNFIINNLIPKTYNIKIEKNNYHSWEKNLTVLQGITTYAQPLLLQSNPKTNLIFNDKNILKWKISDKSKKIFYLKNNNNKISANIYNFSKKTTTTLPLNISNKKIKINDNNSKLLFAPDGNKISLILSQNTPRIILLNLDKKNIIPIDDFTSNSKILDNQWDETSNFFFYLNEKKELNLYNIKSKKSKTVLKNIDSFYLKNGYIYYLNHKNLFFYKSPLDKPLEKQQLSYIKIKNQETKQIDKSKIEKNTKILVSSKNILAIITPEKNLFLIPQNGIPINLGNNIETAIFSKDGERIIFNSFYEIFIYTIKNGQKNIVTRMSQKISNINWYNDYAHIWFTTNQTIKNIEIDPRPTPNIINFINITKKNTRIIYSDSESIYYDEVNKNTLSIYNTIIK